MEDLNEAGGVYAVMNELNKKGLLYTDLHDCYRQDCRQRILPMQKIVNPEVIRPIDNPYSADGWNCCIEGKSLHRIPVL